LEELIMSRFYFATLAALLVGCASTPTAGEGSSDTSGKSLYDRLGGKDAIDAVVADFVHNVAADDRINARFAATDIPAFQKKLADQICEVSGGPCKYTGKDMKAAHANMHITKADFNDLVEDLTKSLDKFHVGDREKNELLGALGSMRPDIVEAN
jgi:hemoglobin